MEPGVWVKSSYSGYNGNCVKVAVMPAGAEGGGYAIGVRDSKDPDGAVLAFSPGAWQEFTARIKTAGA